MNCASHLDNFENRLGFHANCLLNPTLTLSMNLHLRTRIRMFIISKEPRNAQFWKWFSVYQVCLTLLNLPLLKYAGVLKLRDRISKETKPGENITDAYTINWYAGWIASLQPFVKCCKPAETQSYSQNCAEFICWREAAEREVNKWNLISLW